MSLTPVQIAPDSEKLPEVLDLIRRSFAYMEGRIDPPSSMTRLTVEDLSAAATSGEIWAIGAPIVACVVLTPKADALYIGKLSVDATQRGAGLARVLIDLVAKRASVRGLKALELQVRVELTENQATFRALGFTQTGATAHPGFDRPTSLTMRRGI